MEASPACPGRGQLLGRPPWSLISRMSDLPGSPHVMLSEKAYLVGKTTKNLGQILSLRGCMVTERPLLALVLLT